MLSKEEEPLEETPTGIPSDFFDAGFVPEPVIEEEIVRAPTKVPEVPIGDVENLPRGNSITISKFDKC